MSVKARTATGMSPDRRQRRHPRFRSSFPVTLGLFAGDQYRRLEAQCKDISWAGIGLLLGSDLAIGEVVSLTFSLPVANPSAGEAPLQNLRAILRHRRGYHYGFEFLSLTKEQKSRLEQFVQGLERAD